MKQRKYSKTQLKELSNIHYSSLNDGILSSLGSTYLEVFYDFINQSELEDIFTISKNKVIVGYCVISYNTKTILRRAIKATFFDFSKAFLLKLFNIEFQKMVFSSLLKENSSEHESPEIAYIAISKEFTGNGYGEEMLSEVCTFLKQNEHKNIYVKTIDSLENRAVNFYKNNKFFLLNKTRFSGKNYAYLIRNL
jgi:ribosomal protein S18 acetylase RimI-like enzyme